MFLSYWHHRPLHVPTPGPCIYTISISINTRIYNRKKILENVHRIVAVTYPIQVVRLLSIKVYVPLLGLVDKTPSSGRTFEVDQIEQFKLL